MLSQGNKSDNRIFLNAVTFQAVSLHNSPTDFLFIIWELTCILEENSRNVSCYIYHRLELRISLPLLCLPLKDKESSLSCYFTHRSGEKIKSRFSKVNFSNSRFHCLRQYPLHA